MSANGIGSIMSTVAQVSPRYLEIAPLPPPTSSTTASAGISRARKKLARLLEVAYSVAQSVLNPANSSDVDDRSSRPARSLSTYLRRRPRRPPATRTAPPKRPCSLERGGGPESGRLGTRPDSTRPVRGSRVNRGRSTESCEPGVGSVPGRFKPTQSRGPRPVRLATTRRPLAARRGCEATCPDESRP